MFAERRKLARIGKSRRLIKKVYQASVSSVSLFLNTLTKKTPSGKKDLQPNKIKFKKSKPIAYSEEQELGDQMV